MGRKGIFMIDLHIHTTHSSDGQHSPEEIVASAASSGITTLSFCDHMEVRANGEGLALAPPAGIEYLTGVELSTSFEGAEHHLLCYGCDPAGEVLGNLIRSSCARIWGRMEEVLEHFRGMGFTLKSETIKGWGRSVPTGVTMLRALAESNPDDPRVLRYTTGDRSDSPYLNFYRDYALEAFGSLIRAELPDLLETIDTLKDAGILVLAHPGKEKGEFLKLLKNRGLRGIEVYSSYHGPGTIRHLQDLASSLGLLASAGSDFHGEKIKPGLALGDVQGPPDAALLDAVRNAMSSWNTPA
jgi:predicted metal-dependent phosphoesterase TrpH